MMEMKFRLLTAALLAAVGLSAQVDMDVFQNMNMRHVGPGTMSGRVTSIDVVQHNPNVIYVGTASGGLWMSETGGMTWEPIFDNQPQLSIGAVTINQNNPDEIWAGTGEGNPRNSHTSGGGIFKSIDGGHSWQAMGLEKTKTIHRVIVHADDANTVYAGALGSAWGPHPERGLFRTQDGGRTWDNILFVNDSTGCADLIVDPTNPNKLFAAMWEFGRKPWTFNSGGEGSGLYVSHDGGDTWVKRTEDDGLPKGNLGRIGLGISRSNPNIVYALVESSGAHDLYKSTDGGFNWNKVLESGNAGNRPFYYADIRVNPKDPKEVWSLWSMVSRSDDGGKSFQTVIPYSGVHPDHHAFYIHPDNPNFMMDGNDGGLNISHDGGNTWQFVSNLPLGQFYHINYDMETPYHIYGGMQDNGSWVAPGYVWHGGGIRNEDWQEISFGDGFDVVPVPGDGRYAYSMWQEGNVMRVDLETGSSPMIKPVHPEGEKLRFNWNAAIAADPLNNDGVYFGTQFVHHSADRGESWTILSPDLTSPDSLKLQQSVTSGGLTPDVTGAENHHTLLCIAPSPAKSGVIWAGTDDGNVHITQNNGEVWDNCIDRMKGAPKGAWIPQIEPSRTHPGEAFVVVNDYRRNNWEPYLYHTTDYGRKWTRIIDASDVNGHVLCVVQDPVEPRLLFAGTENGLYVSFDYGESWNPWTHDYPNVSTMDLKIHPREHDLIIGTFGRAAYILDDITPLREMAASEGAMTDRALQLIHATPGWYVDYTQPAGIRFPGDAHWRGENKPSAVMMSLWARIDGEGDSPTIGEGAPKKGDKAEKAVVRIMNTAGDTLRMYDTEIDTTGVHRIYWGMDTNGLRWPSWRDRKEEKMPPGGGMSPEAGSYIMVVEFMDARDSLEIQVNNDPRNPPVAGQYAAVKERYERWAKAVTTSSDGFDQLKQARASLKRIQKQFAQVEDSLKTDMTTLADSLGKAITEIQHRYMLPQGTKGYNDESDLLSTYMWSARSHLDNGVGMPTQNGLYALEQYEAKVEEIRTDINALFEGLWMEWRKAVEALELPPLFEDIEKLD